MWLRTLRGANGGESWNTFPPATPTRMGGLTTAPAGPKVVPHRHLSCGHRQCRVDIREGRIRGGWLQNGRHRDLGWVSPGFLKEKTRMSPLWISRNQISSVHFHYQIIMAHSKPGASR